jgi:hypothetical protein
MYRTLFISFEYNFENIRIKRIKMEIIIKNILKIRIFEKIKAPRGLSFAISLMVIGTNPKFIKDVK